MMLLATRIFGVLLTFLLASQLSLDKADSSMTIKGDSSLHEWDITVEDFGMTADMNGQTLSDVKLTVRSKSLESGKSIMNSKAYDALKVKSFPRIEFKAQSLTYQNDHLKGKGTLSIAGTSNTINIDMKMVENADGSYQIKGDVPLLMTDYNIEPPTALFGTLDTYDEVTVHFDLNLTLKNN